jgi:predicted nucleic acid-binding protein
LIYADASVVVSVFLADVHTGRVLVWLAATRDALTLSPWTVTEFSSAAARQARIGQISQDRRQQAEQNFDAWLSAVEQTPVLRADFEFARDLIRKGPSTIRAADALHVAIARRLGARVATFDAVMADAARDVGLAIEAI